MGKQPGRRLRTGKSFRERVRAIRERELREKFPAIWADPELREKALGVDHAGWHDDREPDREGPGVNRSARASRAV